MWTRGRTGRPWECRRRLRLSRSGPGRGASGLRIAVVASSGVNGSGTFNGNIVNTGSIFSSGRNGIHIEKVGAALFSGNISNGGALTATNDTASW